MRINPRRRRERQASNGPRMRGGRAPRPEPGASNLRVQMLPIGQIKTNPRNSKTHPAKQISQIRNSIVAFGFTNPRRGDADRRRGPLQGSTTPRPGDSAGHRPGGTIADETARPCDC